MKREKYLFNVERRNKYETHEINIFSDDASDRV